MEPLSTSVEESSIRETLEKFQKAMVLLIHDNDERQRSDLTCCGARYGPEFIPAQIDASNVLPPPPSPGDLFRDTSGPVSTGDNPGVSSIGKASVIDGQVGVERSTGGAQPHASCLFVPPGSAGAHPLKLKLPREEPPRFSGSKGNLPRVCGHSSAHLYSIW